MINFFNNREWAIIIWAVIALVICLFNQDIRTSIINTIKVFFNIKIIIPYILMFLYIGFFVYILYKTPIWNITLLKDSIIWFFITSFSLLYTSVQAENDKKIFHKLLIKNFTIGIFVQYAVGLYPFSLIAELFLQPILALVFIFIEVCKRKKEFKVVENIFCVILFFIITLIIWHSIIGIMSSSQSFMSWSTLVGSLLPAYLTIIVIPFLFLLSKYSQYEQRKVMKSMGLIK